MIRLHYSNRLENLIEPLAQAVAEQQAERPLEPVVIALPESFVPGPFGEPLETYHAIEPFVRFKLADRLGVAANLDFPSIRGYLTAILERGHADLRLLSRQDLQLVVFECLRASPFKDDPELSALNNPAGAATGEPESEVHTFELAAKLGHLLYEYVIGRPAMLRKWRAGAMVAAEPYRRVERFQRRLYLALFQPDRTLNPRWAAQTDYRLMLLPDALETVAPSSIKAALPPVLHVFGCSDADPLLARALALLRAAGDLRVYALNPCREFWENLTAERDLSFAAGAETELDGRVAEEAGANGPENTPGERGKQGNDCAPLQLWGRSGRELTRMLNELSEYDFDSHFASAADDGQQTLLGALQDSILNGESERSPATEEKPAADSAPIGFLACPGPRREVEAVADAIWSLMRENDELTAPGAAPLRFHEIAVVFPDSQRHAYLPHIKALFEQRYEIPLNVVNPPLSSESRVAEAMRLLLDLPLSRFTRTEVVRLLTHPAITRAKSEADVEQWRDWCDELGIVLGADAREFAGTYVPKDAYHWDQALRRLALGVFMEGERRGETELFHAKDGCVYLPFEVNQSESESVAKLVCTARGLLASALKIKEAQLAPSQWADVLIKFAKTYVQTQDSADEWVFDHYLRALESIAPRLVASGPVSYDVARRLAARRLADIAAVCGNLSYIGLAVGSLSALRALPFRAIFFLGLGAAGFPERERPDWRDLRPDKRERGDLALNDRQRYWFLQTLLAARERFFVSYGSLDPQTGDPLDPSVVVHELRAILRGYVGQTALAQMTISHPLSRYDLERFPELRQSAEQSADKGAALAGESAGRAPDAASFDFEARQAARMSALRENLGRHCAPAASPEGSEVLELLATDQRRKLARRLRLPETRGSGIPAAAVPSQISLPLAALRRFLECPIQGTAAYALGMLEDEQPETEEDEPLSQSGARRVGLLRNAFWRGQGDYEAVENAYLETFRVEQAKGRAPFGPFARAQQRTDLALAREWCRLARELELHGLPQWEHLVIGHTDEFAEAPGRILPTIRLCVPRRAASREAPHRAEVSPTTVSVSLFGQLPGLSPTLGRALVLVAREKATAKDFLGPVVFALALRAAGALRQERFETIILAAPEPGRGKAYTKMLSLPTAQQALTYLTNLTEDLLNGQSDYFLPIEAVAAVLAAQRSAEGARRHSALRLVEQLRENQRVSVSSDYGPVRNARRAPAPRSGGEIDGIIARRFKLLRSIFA